MTKLLCAKSRFLGKLVLSFLAASPCIAISQTTPSDLANFQFSQVDLKLLDEVNDFDRQLEKKGLVLRNDDLTTYVEDIGNRLLAGQPTPERVNFKFRVLRDPMINAFALPNGSIYVNTGLLAVLENEGELASVLGHEITHVTHRHTYFANRSLRKKMVAIDIFEAVGAAGGYAPIGSVFGVAAVAAGALGGVMVTATVYGYSQDLEREADRNGIDTINRAGYDPRSMPRTFERLDERLEYEPIEGFYRSHPKLAERRATTQELANNMAAKGQKAGTEAEYLTKTAPAICYNIQADLESRRARTALARARRLTSWQPQNPNYQVLEGDAYRALGAKTAEPSAAELEKHGQAEHRKRYFKLTEEEEQKELLSTPGGADQRQTNFGLAEKHYLEAVKLDATLADPHRGLGFLYEAEARSTDAAREYHRYLELAPSNSFDRLRIERRVTALEKAQPASPPPSAQAIPQPATK